MASIFIWSCNNYGIKRDMIATNPAANIEKYPATPRRRYVPPLPDVMKVLAVGDQEQRAYLAVIVNTMARVREINRLKWKDIHKDYLILRTRKAKNSDLVERKIPLNKTLLSTLDNIPRDGEYVFPNPRTGKPYDYRKKMMRGLCKRAGVKPFTFHALRHLGATRLDNKKVPLTIIQGLLGHQRGPPQPTSICVVYSSKRLSRPRACWGGLVGGEKPFWGRSYGSPSAS